jgi:2'-5' RNA ligase
MRLFLGVELSDQVSRAAAAITAELRARVEREAPRARLRWIRAENLHVTVWFFGEVRDAAAESLLAALRHPLEVPAFTLGVSGTGMFPAAGPARVVWLGLAAGREGLNGIYDRLLPRLSRLGFEAEKRPYNPHLTIARVKDIPRAEVAAVRRILEETVADAGECRVEAVTLFKSRTSPHGAEYEHLFRVPLE